uniref:phosphoethanolamine N-methyltransferase n=1 Tax=Acrobeloides nanus TaxID=290746 RepID=A0A914DQ92_9BILA
MKQVDASLYVGSNFLDVYWVLSKSRDLQLYDQKLVTFRDFLDKTQYTEDNVKAYEWIFGENFISPGGAPENLKILKKFKTLRPEIRMLDIGVGIGGGARQVAREFGVHVLGCDLSSNMLVHALERNQRDKDHRVQYQICDATIYKHDKNKFDVVFSRDCVQHISDLKKLFHIIYDVLKPGGEFLITLYGKGFGELKPKFLDYVNSRHYFLKNIKELDALARTTGFEHVHTENLTPRFKEILFEERDKAVQNKVDFIEKFGEELYKKTLVGWENKLQFIDDDNHNWLLIQGFKPKD